MMEATKYVILGGGNVLAVARQHLGSFDRVTRIVRLGVSVATVEMSAISRKSLTARPNCCKTFSEKKGILADWCTASQAFRSVRRSNWK
jgi:hypothetical protein